MSKYKYIAIKPGILAEPYRRVKVGELVVSEKPINASWLVTQEKYRETEKLPLTPQMNPDGTQKKKPTGPHGVPATPHDPFPQINDETYNNRIERAVAREKKQKANTEMVEMLEGKTE